MSESRRILLCPSAYYPSFGGVEEICRNLANELAHSGFSVAIAVNRWPAGASRSEIVGGIPIYRFDLGAPSKTNLDWLWQMPQAAADFHRFVSKWDPDIIHVICPSTNSFYIWLEQLIKRRKLLLTFQGELFMDNFNLYGQSKICQVGASESSWCHRQYHRLFNVRSRRCSKTIRPSAG